MSPAALTFWVFALIVTPHDLVIALVLGAVGTLAQLALLAQLGSDE